GEALFNMLRELRKERMASGSIEDHVFLWRGKPLNKDRCRYAWDEAREQLGLPQGPTFYSLKTLTPISLDAEHLRRFGQNAWGTPQRAWRRRPIGMSSTLKS
ncbi:MAG TPA: hypothetical protein VGR69_07495, partial [Candidatus Rubrimentiphilum sp.]|nr:hypothetical protein [Candidatus Rubrimentiphilum sp.]